MGKAAPPPFGRWAKSGNGPFFNVLEFVAVVLRLCVVFNVLISPLLHIRNLGNDILDLAPSPA